MDDFQYLSGNISTDCLDKTMLWQGLNEYGKGVCFQLELLAYSLTWVQLLRAIYKKTDNTGQCFCLFAALKAQDKDLSQIYRFSMSNTGSR